MREIKRNELIALYQKVQGWNQQAQDMYQQKLQEKLALIRDKAMQTVKQLPKKNGYSYVLDANSIMVDSPGDDLIDLVKRNWVSKMRLRRQLKNACCCSQNHIQSS